ncbi:hypothetical protein KSP40_PGU021382 [Platanthera guangdongensis]|uniref:Uncharacterized protein n=1 Tax=Platanthera guangdongensis TaxID=2320717 RepID=A0ABR2MXU7_9ASPA
MEKGAPVLGKGLLGGEVTADHRLLVHEATADLLLKSAATAGRQFLVIGATANRQLMSMGMMLMLGSAESGVEIKSACLRLFVEILELMWISVFKMGASRIKTRGIVLLRRHASPICCVSMHFVYLLIIYSWFCCLRSSTCFDFCLCLTTLILDGFAPPR